MRIKTLSRLRLGFRSVSPIASQSVPHAGSSVFLTEDEVPPSNQLEVQQIVVSDTMLLGPPGGMQLTEVVHAANDHSIFPASYVANILL